MRWQMGYVLQNLTSIQVEIFQVIWIEQFLIILVTVKVNKVLMFRIFGMYMHYLRC